MDLVSFLSMSGSTRPISLGRPVVDHPSVAEAGAVSIDEEMIDDN